MVDRMSMPPSCWCVRAKRTVRRRAVAAGAAESRTAACVTDGALRRAPDGWFVQTGSAARRKRYLSDRGYLPCVPLSHCNKVTPRGGRVMCERRTTIKKKFFILFGVAATSLLLFGLPPAVWATETASQTLTLSEVHVDANGDLIVEVNPGVSESGCPDARHVRIEADAPSHKLASAMMIAAIVARVPVRLYVEPGCTVEGRPRVAHVEIKP